LSSNNDNISPKEGTSLAVRRHMQTESTTPSTTNGRIEPSTADIVTKPHARLRLRKGIFAGAVAFLPAAIGGGIGTLMRSKRAGALAGGIAAGALALARWQLQRFFNDEPAYESEKRIGDLEIRNYRPHVIARAHTMIPDWDEAQEQLFERLASYIFSHELPMTGPVEMAVEGQGFTMAFVMPPGRSLLSLPRPDDNHVRLLEVPARRIAVLPFRGRYNAETVEERERELLRLVAHAGLSAKGRPTFAGFDPPSTLPLLRRNEIWVQII
jgi:hypothetical protein